MNNFDFLSQIKGGKQLTQSNDINAYVLDVTPEVAYSLLNLNFEHNRTLRPSLVKRFKAMIERDEFLQGSPIRLAKSESGYVLIDGQHRLNAIAESGHAATLTAIVSQAQSDEAVRVEYGNADSAGFLRSLADTVAALDSREELPTGTVLSFYTAAARVIAANFNVHSSRFAGMSRQIAYSTLLDFKEQVYLTKEWFGKARKDTRGGMRGFMRAGVLSVALVTTKYAEPEVAKGFWFGAYQDDGLRKNDPRKRLYEYLYGSPINSGSGGMQKVMMVATKCWNAYIAGEEIVQLKMPRNMSDIALTPYPLKEEMPTEE